jgi:hypothetical protein
MHADSYFTIGKTHDICEDFTLTSGSNTPYAILSDGCSGSLKTDFGSRLLVLANEHWLQFKNKTLNEINDITANSIRRAQNMARAISLPEECLDATLLFAHIDGPHINVCVAGDGVVAARKRSGEIEIHCIEYPSGAPAYLNYISNHERAKAYFAQDQGCKKTSFINDVKNIQITNSGLAVHNFQFLINHYNLIMIMSDGAMSFQKTISNDLNTSKCFENISVLEIVTQLMKIKNPIGKFITRRCKRFLKECNTMGWHHNDDFSVAALYLE